jgi:hypothetical protein
MPEYGAQTDAGEKLRQHYAEHNHPSIICIPGGYLALWYWFPTNHRTWLIPPAPLQIDGRCLVSYWAGYEHAKREEHFYDWYGDAKSISRTERRRLAFLFESHVRDFFARGWPTFYQGPSNAGQWARPALDDFSIKLPNNARYVVDTKSASYSKEGHNCYMIRHLRSDTIYIAGKWDDVSQKALVNGIIPGAWLHNVAGYQSGDFIHDGNLMSFEVIPVMLNMAMQGQSYREIFREIANRRSSNA